MMHYGPETEKQIQNVVDVCQKYGSSSIIALSGVPATGKSYIAAIAAQRHAGEPTRVREVQFHQSFTYEEFVEGLRINEHGAVDPVPGVFLEWNNLAADDGELNYVLLVEELTRANLGSVLGELLTYVEHRDRQFLSMFSRTSSRVAPNLTILATYNPVDRSAIDVDDALIRRLRIIDFPPSVELLEEMMLRNGVSSHVIQRLKGIFESCKTNFPSDYETLMPFGHGVFSEIRSEDELFPLWQQRLRRMLYRPLLDPHAFAETIEKHYPWTDPEYREPVPAGSPAEPTTPTSES